MCEGVSYACTHAHTHAHTHARTCMLNMLNMLNMDASMSAAICNFYTCINVCVCVFCPLMGIKGKEAIYLSGMGTLKEI